MPKIKPVGNSELFGAMQQRAAEVGEHNDCSVKAVAAACAVTYDQAHTILRAAGRKDRGRVYNDVIIRAIEMLGCRHQRLLQRDFIVRYPGTHKNLRSVTSHHPARFPSAWQDGNSYLLFVRGHVLAVVNGKVHDWSINNAKRVTMIVRVFQKGE